MKTYANLKQNLSLIDNFIFTSQVEGKSTRTIERYEEVLRPFFAQTNKNPLETTSADIREYLGYLKSLGYAKSTTWTVYKNLNVFYKFLKREGCLKENPVSGVAKPRIPKVFPKVLTDTETKRLLFAAKTGDDRFLNRRNYALICLLFDSGLRVSELCGLKLGDVSLESQLVKVYGKGSKERVIPFSQETAKTLIEYLKTRGNLPFEDSFFVTKQGNKVNRYRVFKLIKNFAKKAEIDPKKVSPHVLRHTFATNWIRAGGDGKKLQHLLGHSDGRIVDVYIHLTGIDLKQAHNEFSPLKTLLKR